MTKRVIVSVAIVLAIAVTPRVVSTQGKPAQSAPQPTAAEIEALKKQIEALAAGQVAIERQLQEIKTLLQQGAAARPSPAPAAAGPGPIETVNTIVDTAGAVSRGSAAARITIVEFSDFQCPFCGMFVRDTFALLDKDYIQTGKVRYVFRNYPLESIHPFAFKAGVAAACAAEQGKFWQMHDRLFGNQNALAAGALPGHAQAIGLDMAKFTPCLNSEKTAPRIRQDEQDALKAGVGSTPSFLIGLTTTGDPKVKATRMISGAQPYTTFKSVIDGLLSGK